MEVSANRRRRLDEGTGSSKGFKEFNKIKKEDDKRLSGLTLSAVLGGADTGIDENNKSWEAVKDNVRSHNSGAGWTPSVPVPTSDVMISRRNSGRSSPDDPKYDETYPTPTSPNSIRIRPELGSNPSSRSLMLRRNSSRVPSMPSGRYSRGVDFSGESETGEGHRRNPSSGDEEREEEEEEEEDEEEDGGGGGGKMSLMALLAETDREMGLDGATYMMDDDDEEDEDDDDDEDEDTSFYSSCSVCMVRHKGTSSTPCGHSFCRLCSKELYVQRGNCPKCNAYLMEILEVF